MRRILAIIGIGALVGCLIGIFNLGAPNDYSIGNDTIAKHNSFFGDSDMQGESLNDIRFADFKEADWLDNDYIRTLRRCLDAYCRGEVEYGELTPYRDIVSGRFIIADVEEFVGGGLFIRFIFIDHPEYLFVTNVYSTVDMETRKVVSYSVHHISVQENEYELTRDEIQDYLKEHPELKLW